MSEQESDCRLVINEKGDITIHDKIDVLHHAAWLGLQIEDRLPRKMRRKGKPGEVISRLPEDKRRILRDLKSDDMNQMRIEKILLCDTNWELMHNFIKQKIEFDRKLKVR